MFVVDNGKFVFLDEESYKWKMVIKFCNEYGFVLYMFILKENFKEKGF